MEHIYSHIKLYMHIGGYYTVFLKGLVEFLYFGSNGQIFIDLNKGLITVFSKWLCTQLDRALTSVSAENTSELHIIHI